jgi:hypothetical protein
MDKLEPSREYESKTVFLKQGIVVILSFEGERNSQMAVAFSLKFQLMDKPSSDIIGAVS